MAKIYYKKILAGDINPTTGDTWTLGDVPERWKEEVWNLLFVQNGN